MLFEPFVRFHILVIGLAPEVATLVTLFIRLMSTHSTIMILRSKDYHNEVIISSLQGVKKRPLKDNTCRSTVY